MQIKFEIRSRSRVRARKLQLQIKILEIKNSIILNNFSIYLHETLLVDCVNNMSNINFEFHHNLLVALIICTPNLQKKYNTKKKLRAMVYCKFKKYIKKKNKRHIKLTLHYYNVPGSRPLDFKRSPICFNLASICKLALATPICTLA